MNRSPLLLALALLFFLTANLHLCCRVGVDGEWTPERYSLADARRGELAARAAAEEICPHGARLPRLEERLALSFRPPDGASRELSARILARVSGVSRLYAVSAEGCRFGTVADRGRLEERLRAALYAAMPVGATHARFEHGVEITPVYGRCGSEMSPSDVATAVAQVVPAVFTDREGQRIMG
ncbi:MAG: hypothetical protein IJQ43_06400 [Oscillospiraceae bacterium]|nr:hypothetical protein [Oscillospiraceae bacterium]